MNEKFEENNLFSIYDSKTKEYSPPFIAPTKGAAVRMFLEVVMDGTSLVGKYPEDYTLYCIGWWDNGSAVIESVSPEHVVKGDVLASGTRPGLEGES